jgi:protein SCO1/2
MEAPLAWGIDFTGNVVAADTVAGTMTLRGPGLAKPDADGNQTVQVGSGDAAIGYVGHKVKGNLHQSGGAWRFDDIWPADPAGAITVTEVTRRLHQDLAEMGRKSYRDVGDHIPDFALYNQNGQLIRAASLTGHRLVINFIFTKCADPTMCQASTRRMAQLQQDLKDAKINDTSLVTITLDPENDTPGILHGYAQAYHLDGANFQLLTGPSEEVNDLLEQFGILSRTVDGILQHTASTILVSPEGRILYRKEGSLWTSDEFMERLKPPAPKTSPAS